MTVWRDAGFACRLPSITGAAVVLTIALVAPGRIAAQVKSNFASSVTSESMAAVWVARERGLFNLDTTIYLYDLTSTYFEGQCARNAKAKRGYSRDYRPDCKQVVVGQSRGAFRSPVRFLPATRKIAPRSPPCWIA